MNETQGETTLDPRLTWYIAIGNLRSWGRAESANRAIAHMHREARGWLSGGMKTTEYVVYRASEGTYVDGMGGLGWPKDDPAPIKIKHVKPKK
jgi:hypothetical protein